MLDRDSFLSNIQGKLLSETNLTLNGHMGREYVIEVSDQRLHIGRVFLVETRMERRIYVLSAAGNWTSASEPSPTRFFQSFKVPPKAATGPGMAQ